MAKVSIIMSVYNQEKFVTESLNSILNQTYKDFEVIIVNDGSTDKSLEIMNNFSDSRLKIIENDSNKGLIYSLNKGLELSLDSEYIARMDSDDICFLTRLEEQVNFLNSNKKIGLLGTGVNFFGDNIKQYNKYPPIHHKQLLSTLFCQNPFYHPTIMMRSGLFKGTGCLYNSDFPKYEDYAMWVELSDKCEFANLRKVLVNYRRHSKNEGAVYNNNPDLDCILFKKIISLLCEKLQISLTEDEKTIISIITSKSRSNLNRNISLKDIFNLIELVLSKVTAEQLDKAYLRFKLFERTMLYLITCKRFKEIPLLIKYKDNFINLNKLIWNQYTRKD